MASKHRGVDKTSILSIPIVIALAAVVLPFSLYFLVSGHTDQNLNAAVPAVKSQPGMAQSYPATGINKPAPAPADALVILINDLPQDSDRGKSLERDLLLKFARQAGKTPVWIEYRSDEDLLSKLNEDNEDLIISGMENSSLEFDSPIEYSLPWGILSQQVVARSDSQRIRKLEDLYQRQIAIKKSSPAYPLLKELSAAHPSMDIMEIPENLSIDDVLTGVSSGYYDISVADNFTLDQVLPKYLDLETAISIDDGRIMTWAVRSGNGQLHLRLNQFLYKNHMQLNISEIYRDDLPELQERKLLRLITSRGPVNYYLKNGRLQGFEYELIQRFASLNHMRVEVVIAGTYREMQQLLQDGHGDVIAASLPYDSFGQDQGVAHTQYYSYSTPYIVGRALDYPLVDARELEGRRVVLPDESPYQGLLQRIKKQGINFEIIHTKDGQDTAAILNGVSQGLYDLTVISGQRINAEFSAHTNLKNHFKLSEPLPHAWVVRKDNKQLLTALNEFIEREYRKSFYNVLLDKYIEHPVSVTERKLISATASLSPYDEIVFKYAEKYGFDWRLIIAQMYQESRFNPAAVSTAGAEGLMQLIPETAQLLGVSDVNDPDASIQGGIKYLAYLRDRFEDDLQMEDRTWFSLAAYNAGYNRVKHARWLADQMSLDKNKWFDNVEKAMQALSKPYRKDGVLTRYCRCGQTTYYIREIKTLYDNYVRLTQASRFAYEPTAPGEDI